MPATTGDRPGSSTGRSNFRRVRRRRSSSGGHPSRGGTTVGGGTGGRKPTAYRSPTPSPPRLSGTPYEQLRRSGELDRRGRQKRPGPRYGPGRRGPQRILPGAGLRERRGMRQVVPVRLYRELLRQGKIGTRQRHAFERSVGGFARAKPLSPQFREASILGIGEKDIGRFLESRVIGRQTPVGGFARGIGELAKPSLRDAASLPANVVTGAYYTGRAGVKAARGDTSEAKRLWKDFKETDPVALAVQGRFGEAGRSVGEHPLLALLEVSGVGAGVSRGAGTAARRASGGRVASTRRAPRRVEGTNVVELRRWSPGVVGKTGQVAVERARRASSRRAGRKAELAERRGDVDKADELRAKAIRRDPDRAPDRAIEHQVDLVVEGLGQSIRRPARAQTAREIRRVLPKRGGEIVSLVAQNIVRADKSDLRAYVRELEAEAPGLRPAKRKANQRLRAQIQKVLASKKVDMAELETAARAYAGVLKPLEDEVVAARMLAAPEAEMAKLKPYAVRNMRVRDDGEKLVHPDGRAVTSGEIKAHMRSRGIDPAGTAFVTHAPGRLGDRSFNVSGRKPQGIPRQRRTGAAVVEGTVDVRPERLVEQGVQLRGLADGDRTWKRFVGTFGFRRGDGPVVAHAAKADANRLVRDLEAETGRKWRAVRASPWAGRQEQLSRLLEDADREGFVGGKAHPVSEAIERAVADDADGQGPWIVVPDAAAQRLADHAAVYRSQGPVARTVTQAFRRTVLPLSPSWLTGNVVESALRTAVRGAGPVSWVTFRRTYNQLALGDPSIRRALTRRLPEPRRGSPEEQLLHMVPGGHFGGTHDTMVRVSARQFEKSRLRPVADAAAKLYRNPGPGTVARLYRRYTDWMFGTFNAGIESQFTRAMAGQFMRRELMDRRRRDMNEKAVEQAARGIRETPEQVAMADYVRRAYGQYDAMSPEMRRWVLNYTPFGAWAWNATKFLFNVLPRDHPMLTGVLAANHQLSEDWRRQHGLDWWAENAVPGFLQGSIPLPGGGHLRAARYTPFGLFANEGGPLGAVASTVLPQYSGALMAFRGLDWKGDPFRGGDGEPIDDPLMLGALAAREFAYGSVPGIGLAARLLDKGPSVLNPLNPVKPREESSSSSEKDPVDEAIDEALDRVEDDEIDKMLDEIDKSLEGQRGALAPVRFDAGGTFGARLRRLDDAQARFERDQRRLALEEFHNTGRNYVPQGQYPLSRRRRVRA